MPDGKGNWFPYNFEWCRVFENIKDVVNPDDDSSMFPQCSGYHVRLTRERSPVRAWAETRLFLIPLTLYILKSRHIIFVDVRCKRELLGVQAYRAWAPFVIAGNQLSFFLLPLFFSPGTFWSKCPSIHLKRHSHLADHEIQCILVFRKNRSQGLSAILDLAEPGSA